MAEDLVERITAWASRCEAPTEADAIEAVALLGEAHAEILRLRRNAAEFDLILGVDYNPSPFKQPQDRIRTLQASQSDIPAISKFLAENNVGEVDFIIDDAAHEGYLAKASFWPLFDRYLKKGGHYIIEDWGTGYWPTFVDGGQYVMPDQSRERTEGIFPNHINGMVGFVKQLVDEAHHTAIVNTPDTRPSKFHSLILGYPDYRVESAKPSSQPLVWNVLHRLQRSICAIGVYWRPPAGP